MPVLLRWGHCCIGSLGSLLYWFMAVLVHWGHYHWGHCCTGSWLYWFTGVAATAGVTAVLVHGCTGSLRSLPLGSLLYCFIAVLVHWGHCCTGSWLYWFTEVTAIGITAVLSHCCTGSLGSLLYWFIAVLVHWGHCCTGSWLYWFTGVAATAGVTAVLVH